MDYDIIPGRGSKNAKKALKLAEKRGFASSEVRTFRDGYYVPVEIDEEVDIETIPGTEGNAPIEILGELVPEGEEGGAPGKLVDLDGNDVPVGDDGIPVAPVADEKTADATPEEVEDEKPAVVQDETKDETKADAKVAAPKTTTPRKRAAKKE